MKDAVVRARIIRGALETFSMHGFEGASIAMIARNQGVSPSLIYYYFGSKAGLHISSMAFGLTKTLEELSGPFGDLRDGDPVDQLILVVRRYIFVMAQHEAAFRAILLEGCHRRSGTQISPEFLTPLLDIMIECLENAARAGRIKLIVPPYHLAQIIIGACYQFISSRKRMLEVYGVDTHSAELMDAHATAVIEVLLNGITECAERTGGPR